jgi:peptide/nickel transport system permease protein
VRRTRLGVYLLGLAALAIFGSVAALLVAGELQPAQWSRDVWIEGVKPGTNSFVTPPFPLFTYARVFHTNGVPGGSHYFLLGSDCGGRDLLGLVGRGAPPSLELVALVVLARALVGVLAGLLMASGVAGVRVISRGMGRWVAGFPYLALAIIVIQALSPTPAQRTLLAFAAGMALVGWRDVAEVTAGVVEQVRLQPYSEAALALGSRGLTYFRRHVLPHLRPALAAELPFQASSVLVLVGELGFLQVFVGGAGILLQVAGGSAGAGPNSTFCVLAPQPDLGELLSPARFYIQQAWWTPVLVPALVIALLALGFELLGYALRLRDEARLRR